MVGYLTILKKDKEIVIGFACSVSLKCSDRSVASSELSYYYYIIILLGFMSLSQGVPKLRELSCSALAYDSAWS
jgi:hypothetical protein